MRHNSMTLGAVVLCALSIGLGLVWWVIGWQKGAFAHIPSGGSVILLGLGAFQIVGWVVVSLLLWRKLRGSLRPSNGVVLGISTGALAGNLVWYLTPVLGAPLILLVTVVGLVQLYLLRKK